MSTKTVKLTPGQRGLLIEIIANEVHNASAMSHLPDGSKRLVSLEAIQRKLLKYEEKMIGKDLHTDGNTQPGNAVCESQESTVL